MPLSLLISIIHNFSNFPIHYLSHSLYLTSLSSTGHYLIILLTSPPHTIIIFHTISQPFTPHPPTLHYLREEDQGCCSLSTWTEGVRMNLFFFFLDFFLRTSHREPAGLGRGRQTREEPVVWFLRLWFDGIAYPFASFMYFFSFTRVRLYLFSRGWYYNEVQCKRVPPEPYPLRCLVCL